jgi:hypothetical protein
MANHVAGATNAWRQPHRSRPASWREAAAELTSESLLCSEPIGCVAGTASVIVVRGTPVAGDGPPPAGTYDPFDRLGFDRPWLSSEEWRTAMARRSVGQALGLIVLLAALVVLIELAKYTR